ncbi:MAG: hypothetical protein ACLQF4_03985 [Xanthobacteraceae bacterium]
MSAPHTLTAQTRQAILAVCREVLCAVARGEPTDTAEVRSRIDNILAAFAAAVQRATAHKIHLQGES